MSAAFSFADLDAAIDELTAPRPAEDDVTIMSPREYAGLLRLWRASERRRVFGERHGSRRRFRRSVTP